MKKILTLIFGERAQGEKLPPPTFRVTYPFNRPPEDVWTREVKFGSRYGTRGSFYQNNYSSTVAYMSNI